MSMMKIAAIGVAASMLMAGSVQAATTRSQGAMPVSATTAKKLARSSAPVETRSKDTSGALLGVAALGALGVGVYEIAKTDSSGS